MPIQMKTSSGQIEKKNYTNFLSNPHYHPDKATILGVYKKTFLKLGPRRERFQNLFMLLDCYTLFTTFPKMMTSPPVEKCF